MNYIHVVYTSAGSVVTLFILTKIMGNKQMSQLSMFDYITGITIGSIAAEMATELEAFYKPLIAMVIYALLALLISVANYKSIVLRRLMTGKSLILFEDGKLFEANLKKARLDVNEFLYLCRNSGYFNITNLQSAILEPNGKVSFLPLALHRPLTPCDMNLNPPEERPVINVIIDGKIIKNNLGFTGKDEKWLNEELQKQNIYGVSDIFLATIDNRNNLSAYKKITKKMADDIFQ